jgi:dephospho-CoA kinase
VLTVGLTGGIASGKTLVRGLLAELGCATFDSDQAARALVAPGMRALSEIVQTFGREFVLPDGQLDRLRLARRIFEDAAARSRLQAILHPRIFELQDRFLLDCAAGGRHALAVVDAALMFETGSYKKYAVVVVVRSRPEQQQQRLQDRDHLSAEEASRRIAAQMPLDQKASRADLVIDNAGTKEAIAKQVLEAWFWLLWRAACSGFHLRKEIAKIC